jgi:TRAP transporter TAXI family solute receptor
MKRIWMTALALAGACLGPCSAFAQGAVQLSFATAAPGAAWNNYSVGLAELFKAKLPAGSDIQLKIGPGAIFSIDLVQSGKADIGFGFAHTAASACSGTGVFKEKKDKVLSLLGGLDSYYFATFVTKRSGVTTWEEIAEAKNKFWLLTLRAGSMGEQGVRQVLALLGSSKEAIVERGGFVEATARSATPRQIKDGLAEGWASVVPRGHPMADQMASLIDMAVLPLPESVISGMVEKHGWVETVMPANTYRGQAVAVKTVKSATNLLASASLSDELAYLITRTVVESAGDALHKVHVALSDFDPKLAADPVLNGGCPMHPGAVRYFKEVGLLK